MSNGITTQMTSVSWATGGITIGVIIIGGMISIAKALVSATNATAATPAANGGGHSIAQPHDHIETTASSSTHGPFAHMDPIILFLHFQSISSSGFLSLKYAPIYQAFTVGVFIINRVWTEYIRY